MIDLVWKIPLGVWLLMFSLNLWKEFRREEGQ